MIGSLYCVSNPMTEEPPAYLCVRNDTVAKRVVSRTLAASPYREEYRLHYLGVIHAPLEITMERIPRELPLDFSDNPDPCASPEEKGDQYA